MHFMHPLSNTRYISSCSTSILSTKSEIPGWTGPQFPRIVHFRRLHPDQNFAARGHRIQFFSWRIEGRGSNSSISVLRTQFRACLVPFLSIGAKKTLEESGRKNTGRERLRNWGPVQPGISDLALGSIFVFFPVEGR